MQVLILVELEKGVKIDDENVHVDPNAFFPRIVILLERQEDLTQFY